MLFFGMSMFALYHFLMIPWPFYSGPLDYIPLTIVGNSTVEDTSKGGGCLREYTWCKYTTRVPLPVFVIASTIITGTAFSSVGVASGTLFSEILGPRNQGFMQGLFALFGSIGRFLGPIVSTLLFEKIGYSVPMAILLGMVLLADVVIITFRKRLVPLKLIPPIGVKTPYKNGVFYRF
ncbi:unnamed protein product [Anisakis simplex]|uniref:MFS domain-containing protein n=1 Tax=Anisakis simplex TaxID=6269 RepID=A0A0M3K4U6_ANISI|nr:unnamed protein product [Anisakis simplex]